MTLLEKAQYWLGYGYSEAFTESQLWANNYGLPAIKEAITQAKINLSSVTLTK